MKMREFARSFAIVSLILFVFVSVIPFQVSAAHCSGANRFWVLGAGNWSDTNHWSATSGGAPGVSVPGITNPVFFDTLSGAGTVTLDVNAFSCDVNGTGDTISTVSMGTFTWQIDGDITSMNGDITGGTGTVDLTGLTTQTIGPQAATNLAINKLKISGAGTKVFNQRIVPTLWEQTVSVQINMGTGAVANVGFFPTFALWDAGVGNVLTLRSVTPGVRWNFDSNGVSTFTLRRVNIQDASVTSTALVYATDYSNVNAGNNDNDVKFFPRSSIVEENSSWFTTSSLDYGPHSVRNRLGDIVAIIPDGTGVNNGKLSVRYSVDSGVTWSSRIPLMTPSSDGTGILDDTIGAGWEIWAIVDRNDIMYLVGHKLISGVTHTYFTKIDITNVESIGTFSNWESASGVSAPSLGNAINGQGYDDLGTFADPSVTVRSDGSIVVFMYPNTPGPGAIKIFSGSSWSSAVNLQYGGSNPTMTTMDVVVDEADTLHSFTWLTVSSKVNVVYKSCPITKDCSNSANWLGANGIDNFDYVLSNVGGSFGFMHPVVDSNNQVHVTAGGNFLIDGFKRVWHNYLDGIGDTTWANGRTLDGGGLEINAAQAYPLRSRLNSAIFDRFAIGSDTVGNTYITYRDQQTSRSGFQTWNGTAWLSHIWITSGDTKVSDLHSRDESVFIDSMSTGGIGGVQFQSMNVTSGNAWWDFIQPQPTPCEQITTIVPIVLSIGILIVVLIAILSLMFSESESDLKVYGSLVAGIIALVCALILIPLMSNTAACG